MAGGYPRNLPGLLPVRTMPIHAATSSKALNTDREPYPRPFEFLSLVCCQPC